MMRWFLLGIALAFAGLGLLTVFRLPDSINWKFSVLAGQFGYVAALVPLIVGIAGWRLKSGSGSLALSTCAVSLFAFVLLVQPCFQAWLVGWRLPAKLEAKFGPAKMDRKPFTFGGLFHAWPKEAPKTTWAYSGSLKLVFYPAIGRNPAPCVVVIHGGGWDDGDRGQITNFNDGLARAGIAVADISYRLAPGAPWPAQREDVGLAVAFVKLHAPEWGVDRSRIVIFGRSAGGQIAEASAYALHDPDVRGVIALYAPSDMNFAWKWGRPDDALDSPELMRKFLGGTPETAKAAYDSASALNFVTPKTPPTLLVHGTIDTLVWIRHSRRLSAKLNGAGVANLLVELPWGTHALELNPDSPSGQLTNYAVLWFVGAVCR